MVFSETFVMFDFMLMISQLVLFLNTTKSQGWNQREGCYCKVFFHSNVISVPAVGKLISFVCKS